MIVFEQDINRTTRLSRAPNRFVSYSLTDRCDRKNASKNRTATPLQTTGNPLFDSVANKTGTFRPTPSSGVIPTKRRCLRTPAPEDALGEKVSSTNSLARLAINNLQRLPPKRCQVLRGKVASASKKTTTPNSSQRHIKPTSRLQKYRITQKGRELLSSLEPE